MVQAQRRFGLAAVFLAVAVVASGFGSMMVAPVTAEPAPPVAKLDPAHDAGAALDDPSFLAPDMPGAQVGLGGSARGPLTGAPRAGWDDGSPGIASVPKYTDTDTLGYTWKDPDMGVWKYQKQGPFEFQIDMGDFANKDQLTKNQKGYWLQLIWPSNQPGIQGYFIVDNDGKFDPIDGNYDGIGDEPCHPGKFDIMKLYVNGRFIHTLVGHNEQGCGVEGPRSFELIPMTQGEPASVFRIPTDLVTKGKNTIKIELLDTPFIHPRRTGISPDDGWYTAIMAAAMQLVAPPWIISGGWSFDPPPGGHTVGNSGWEAGLAGKITQYFVDHFGQTPWGWDITPATSVNVGTCAQGAGVQSHGVAEYTVRGVLIVAKDGKQDFRVTGCEVARMIRDAEGTLGYGYHRGKDPVGFWYLGFSMGGLIGRWALQREGLSGSMSKFVTFGTPHTGSHWADIYVQVMDLKGRYRDINGDGLRKWWGGWKDWANNGVQARFFEENDHRLWPPWEAGWYGSGALLDHRADFGIKSGGNALLDGLAIGAGSIADRTLAISGQGGTAAGAVASVITANPIVRAIGFLVEGDGVVPTSSANLNGLYNTRYCMAVHHGGVYSGMEGCTMPTFEHFTGFLGSAALAQPAADPDAVLATAELAQFAHEITPDLVTGEASVEDEVRIGSSPWSMFTALMPDDASLDFTLVSPSGEEYLPEKAAALGAGFNLDTEGFGLHRALWVVPDAEPGVWKIRFAATEDTPAWGTGVVVMVHAESPLDLVADAPDRVDPGQAFVATARLTGAADGVAVQALVMPANVTLALHDDGLDGDAVAGDGVFSLRYGDTAEEGTIQLDLAATATLGGQAIARTTRITVESAQRRALAVTSLTLDTTQMWWGEVARATATVQNTGVATLRDVTVVWTDDSDNLRVTPLQDHVALPALAPGESRVVSLDWMPTPGLRTLVAEAWTSGLEEDVSDNRATASLDVLPSPRTAASFQGPRGLEGWYTGPVKVALGAFDGSPDSYTATHVRLDDGPWTPYLGEFPVRTDGQHLLEFYSVDLQGRTETLRTATFRIDSTAPSVAIARPALGINLAGFTVPAPVSRPVVAGFVEVAIPSSDATSGVARLELRVDGVLRETLKDPPPEAVVVWDSTTSSTGRHTLAVTAWDHAGLSSTATVQVYVTASRAVQIENSPIQTVNRLMPPLG